MLVEDNNRKYKKEIYKLALAVNIMKKEGGKIKRAGIVPLVLLIIYAILFFVLLIRPYDWMAWFADNFFIVIIVLALVLTYRKFQFSNTSYIIMSLLIFINTIGAHYSFSRVPLIAEIGNALFGTTRNYYDRIGHFALGLWAYPIFELVTRKKWINNYIVGALFAFFSVIAIGTLYEIVEYLVVLTSPESGMQFLGAQGDFWDAQKDIVLNILGSLVGLVMAWFAFKKD